MVEPTPLKNMSSTVGMMTFPTEWKNKTHVPNHQPVVVSGLCKPTYNNRVAHFVNTSLRCNIRFWLDTLVNCCLELKQNDSHFTTMTIYWLWNKFNPTKFSLNAIWPRSSTILLLKYLYIAKSPTRTPFCGSCSSGEPYSYGRLPIINEYKWL